MIDHRIEIYSSADELLAIVEKALNRQYTEKLNRHSTFQFELDLNDPVVTEELLAGGQNYIKYYRGNKLIWSGQIVNVRFSLLADSEKVIITCASWFYLLKFRYLFDETTYAGVNEGTILQNLITATQGETNGALGITFGSNTSTETRDRTYVDKNIYDAFVQMSEVIDGLDFEFTPDKVLNIYEKKFTDRSATHVFEYGDNLAKAGVSRDWTDLKNDIKGYGADTLERTASSTSSQDAYTLRQSVENYFDISESATLDGHLDDILRTNGVPIETYTATLLPGVAPEFGSYEIGDYVTLRINKGACQVDQKSRIYGWTVTIDNEGVETIALEISTTL